ncbi:MAG: phosphate acetyltransferase [Pseudomonadota bacterium]
MTHTPIELLAENPPANRPIIALSEGEDSRVLAGGMAAQEAGLADVILVGRASEINAAGTTVHDPATSDLTEGFAQAFYELRKHKGVDEVKARAAVETPLVYAAMLVRQGHAQGTVGGAVHTTADVVRTALQVIGMAPGNKMVSSCMLMYPPANAGPEQRAMVFADCGLAIDPGPDALAEIAAASAASCSALLNEEPRLAMLSFSTMGSGRHALVDKTKEALGHLRANHPDLIADGELQFDAAFTASVGQTKAPGSDVAGQANVMIFPGLEAGNIGYKVAQRLGGYAAIGPVLQGLARPANDLSRGCSAEDVTQMIAVTALQGVTQIETGSAP